jgi:hypothetical protein
MGVKFCIYILLDDYHKCKLKQTDLSIVEKNGRRVPAHSEFFITRGSAAEVRHSQFLRILRMIEMKNYHIMMTMGMY